MQTELLQKKFQLLEQLITEKVKQIEASNEKQIYEMYTALIEQCQIQLKKFNHLEKKINSDQIISYGKALNSLLGELTEALEALIQADYSVVVKKKVYEEVDEVIAELEEWVEAINEDLEEKNQGFEYWESWDIGVFYED